MSERFVPVLVFKKGSKEPIVDFRPASDEFDPERVKAFLEWMRILGPVLETARRHFLDAYKEEP